MMFLREIILEFSLWSFHLRLVHRRLVDNLVILSYSPFQIHILMF